MNKLSIEEAIKILKDMKVDIPVPKAAVTQIKRNIALDMVIDVLSNCLEFPNSWTPECNKGKWIQDGHHIQCNQCGISMCDKDREGDVLPKKFCPNCGSYNGGKEDE